ncbi:MAG TPA: hypothetical protein VF980_09630 [Thermoanaerobaculia bacterium]
MNCPDCGSEHTRRGGNIIWGIYAALIAAALVAVLKLGLNAALVAGVIICAIVIAHLGIGGRVCLDCGHQFR